MLLHLRRASLVGRPLAGEKIREEVMPEEVMPESPGGPPRAPAGHRQESKPRRLWVVLRVGAGW